MKLAKERIKNFIEAVKKMLKSGYKGIIEVMVHCICNWKLMKKAIQFLLQAKKSQGARKWLQIGKFVGGFVIAIGTK